MLDPEEDDEKTKRGYKRLDATKGYFGREVG